MALNISDLKHEGLAHPVLVPEIQYGKAKPKHVLEALPLYALNAIFRVLPRTTGLGLAHGLARFAQNIIKKKVSQSCQSIQEHLKCDSTKAQEIIQGSFLSFSENWYAQVCPQKYMNRETFSERGFERLIENSRAGKGSLIAAMHMGLWESVPAYCAQRGIPLAVVVAVQHNPLCDEVFNRARSFGGYHCIIHNRLGIRHLIQYLKKGGIAVILSDVDIGGTGLAVPFLGKIASTPGWPTELASRTGADLFLGYHVKKQGVMHYEIDEIPKPSEDGGGKFKVWKWSENMNDAMSEVVKAHPEQWFWMQRRWKTPVERLKAKPSPTA